MKKDKNAEFAENAEESFGAQGDFDSLRLVIFLCKGHFFMMFGLIKYIYNYRVVVKEIANWKIVLYFNKMSAEGRFIFDLAFNTESGVYLS